MHMACPGAACYRSRMMWEGNQMSPAARGYTSDIITRERDQVTSFFFLFYLTAPQGNFQMTQSAFMASVFSGLLQSRV